MEKRYIVQENPKTEGWWQIYDTQTQSVPAFRWGRFVNYGPDRKAVQNDCDWLNIEEESDA